MIIAIKQEYNKRDRRRKVIDGWGKSLWKWHEQIPDCCKGQNREIWERNILGWGNIKHIYPKVETTLVCLRSTKQPYWLLQNEWSEGPRHKDWICRQVADLTESWKPSSNFNVKPLRHFEQRNGLVRFIFGKLTLTAR